MNYGYNIGFTLEVEQGVVVYEIKEEIYREIESLIQEVDGYIYRIEFVVYDEVSVIFEDDLIIKDKVSLSIWNIVDDFIDIYSDREIYGEEVIFSFDLSYEQEEEII